MTSDPNVGSESSEPSPPRKAWRITTVQGRRFRNLDRFEFRPHPNFNVLFGDNGAGKSSVLELIHYASALRSFRLGKTDEMIAVGESESAFRMRVEGDVAPRTLAVQLTRGRARRVQLDGKRPRSTADYQTAVQTVVFHPAELALASGGPELRRQFMDAALCQQDAIYDRAITTYSKALRSRNRLLKSDTSDAHSIRSYDRILATSGAVIGTARARFIEEVQVVAERVFDHIIADDRPNAPQMSIRLKVQYEPRVIPEPNQILSALQGSFAKDRTRKSTTEGPHRDDLGLALTGQRARGFASQGQQRSIALALKIAELEVIHQRTGRLPILLLDDVSSELDRTRNRRLFDFLGQMGGQVFLTTTHPEFILLRDRRLDVEVLSGVLRPQPAIALPA